MLMERLKKLQAALSEYEDGAITYVELVRYFVVQVTEEDVRDHNGLLGNAPDGWSVRDSATADTNYYLKLSGQWPFGG